MGVDIDWDLVGADRGERAAVWLEDLHWHKVMYRKSCFQWTGEHAMAIVTGATGGRLTYCTVGDLERLEVLRQDASAYGWQARMAMAERLRAARAALVGPGGPWSPISEVLGLSEVECAQTVWFARYDDETPRDNPDIRRVLRALPFTNPLIEVWELKQLWRLYEAAAGIFEATMADLVEELRPTRPAAVLARAAAAGYTEANLQVWLDAAHERHGRPGDPKRVPVQAF